MSKDEKENKPAVGGLLRGVTSVAHAVLSIPQAVSEIASFPSKVINHATSELANIPGKIVSQVLPDSESSTLRSEWINPDELPYDEKEIVLLSIKFLQPNPMQPRKHFDAEQLKQLSESIKAKGILSPLLVRKLSSNKYEIIAGERRYRAALMNGMTEMPVIVKDVGDLQAFELAVIENIQRENLNPVEEAEAYKVFADMYGCSQEEIAAKVGKSRSYVANLLSILSLPKSVLNQVREGDITTRHARALIGHKDSEKLVEDVIAKKLNVRQTEDLVKISKDPTLVHQDKDVIEQLLSEKLRVTVKVDEARKQFVISYKEMGMDAVVVRLLSSGERVIPKT